MRDKRRQGVPRHLDELVVALHEQAGKRQPKRVIVARPTHTTMTFPNAVRRDVNITAGYDPPVPGGNREESNNN